MAKRRGVIQHAAETISHGFGYARHLLRGNRVAGDMSWVEPGSRPVVLVHGFLGTRGTMLSRPFSLKKAIAHGVTFNVGVTVNPTKRFNIALTYFHSTHMKYHGKFAVDLNDPFFTQDLVAQGLKFKPLVTGNAILEYDLPKRITLGLGYDIGDRWRVDGFVQYIRYSALDAFRVTATSPDLAQPALGRHPDTLRLEPGQLGQELLDRGFGQLHEQDTGDRLYLGPDLLMESQSGYRTLTEVRRSRPK